MKKYRREFVGDVQFIDDPNDDWFCITFDKWSGDFCPNNIYFNKISGRIRIQKGAHCELFGQYLLFLPKSPQKYEFDKHHRIILEKFIKDAYKAFEGDSLIETGPSSLRRVNITMSQQRV